MNNKFDIIVVGSGLVGLAFVLDMAKRDHRLKLAIIDAKPFNVIDTKNIDNRIYAISPHNVGYLKSLAIWPEETGRIGTISTMDIYGDDGGNILLDKKDAYQAFLAKTVEYNYLQQNIISELIRYDNVQIFVDRLKLIEYIDGNQIKLIGANANYTSSLIVGSDGSNSFVRQSMGIAYKEYDYQQYGVVANFECTMPHYNIARQWFINGKILAYLPMPAKRISIVFSCDNHNDLLEMDSITLSNYVAAAGKHSLGDLTLLGKAEAFPLRLYLIDKVWRKNVVLIGDAAHTIHPLAGQGVNLGFSDARLLAQRLSEVSSYQFGDTSVLSSYGGQRILAVKKMQYICHALQLIFKNDNILAHKLRNVGLNMVNGLPFIKKFLISNVI